MGSPATHASTLFQVIEAEAVADQPKRTLRAIDLLGLTDLLIFTDGYTSGLQENGGAGFVIHNARDLLYSCHGPAIRRFSFHTAERAIGWLHKNRVWQSAVFIFDCRSLVDALGNPFAHDEIVKAIHSKVTELRDNRRFEIMLALGHCELAGNELADAQAELGSTMSQVATVLDVAS